MKKQTPQERVNEIVKYFTGRGIKNYAVVMTAVNPALEPHIKTIHLLCNYRRHAKDKHLDIIAGMERVVALLEANDIRY